MARIKIKDLPKDMKVTRQDLRQVIGGSVTLGANSLSVVNSSGGIIAAFPDVCTTPSPGGPIPIPYPNIGMASDTSGGSKSVKVSSTTAMVKGSVYSSSEGDEPGTTNEIEPV